MNFELVGYEASSIQDIRNEIATMRDIDEQAFRLYHDHKETIGYRRGREYVSIFNADVLELDMRLKIKGGGGKRTRATSAGNKNPSDDIGTRGRVARVDKLVEIENSWDKTIYQLEEYVEGDELLNELVEKLKMDKNMAKTNPRGCMSNVFKKLGTETSGTYCPRSRHFRTRV